MNMDPDELCIQTQEIKDYLGFTNESLRAAVKEYFEDKAAAEYRHGKMGTWDVSRVTGMSELFANRWEWAGDPGLAAWDTSAVTTMRSMFFGCRVLTADLSSWDTSSVVNCSYMFYHCFEFSQDISAWDTSSVTHMVGAFFYAGRINCDLSRWNTAAVIRRDVAFTGTDALLPEHRPTFG